MLAGNKSPFPGFWSQGDIMIAGDTFCFDHIATLYLLIQFRSFVMNDLDLPLDDIPLT